MSDSPARSVAHLTRLLREAHDGSETAFEKAAAIVYDDLNRVAERQLRRRYGGDPKVRTLEPSALVNETFLRLIRQRKPFANRQQFFAVATRLMLRVLMNYDRDRRRGKRGGDLLRVSLGGVVDAVGAEPSAGLAEFACAVEKLDGLDPRAAEVAKLRLVWGLTSAEVAESTGMSLRSAEREWRFARTWLAEELSPQRPDAR